MEVKIQAPVVQKVDSGIHWMMQMDSLILIPWIATYPVGSAIQRLNNRGQGKELGICVLNPLSHKPLWHNTLCL